MCWSYIDTQVSGSPIIQNGKLVGVLTHVLIDNPQKGYGIFAENMLETSVLVSKENFKEASQTKPLQDLLQRFLRMCLILDKINLKSDKA